MGVHTLELADSVVPCMLEHVVLLISAVQENQDGWYRATATI